MKTKQWCAALLAGTLLTSTMVMADPSVTNGPLPVAVPIMAQLPAPTMLATFAIGEPTATVDGKSTKLAFAPYLHEGVTMVPLQLLANYLNASLSYNPTDQSVTIAHQGKNKVTFVLDRAEIKVNGVLKKLPALTELIEDRSSVPLRALAELFGVDVRYADGVVTLVRQAPAVERIPFLALDGKLQPVLDYSLAPRAYTGYAKDLLIDYPKDQGNALILAISQPGQEVMIQSIEAREDKVIVHVLPENRWSNAPAGTMGLVYYGPRRVVKLESPLPDLPIEIDGYEAPAASQSVAFTPYAGSTELSTTEREEAGLVTKQVDGRTVIIACAGAKPTTGYSLEVQRVEHVGNKLVVHAQLTSPAPDSINGQMITYPSDAFALDALYSALPMELVIH